MPFHKYIDDIVKRYKTGTAREHTYRPALQNLLEEVIPGIMASNDPARIECGAPDFILSRRKIDVGYIEAKDIADDLDKTEKTEQLKRYRESLDNLILTDYLEFRFFMHGEKVETICIGDVQGNGIRPLTENFYRLKTLLIDFAAFQGQTIKSAKKLAEMMAHKARLMRGVFFKAVQDESGHSTLHEQLKAFKTVLVHDMDPAQFADVYAQTIAYGLFTARLHDESLGDFSRAEALTLIPKSNPFLRQLFHYVAGPDLDDRVVWIVDALCEVYRATDLHVIMKDFGSATGQNDPILHFYETFLAEYDPKLRKSRGVFYTPESVVNFIVRAIDYVLRNHFGLKDGLADKSKVEIEVDSDRVNKKTGKLEKDIKEVHKVQLLDVATGTGTFLAEIVKQVYARFKGQEGLWSQYVEKDLLPRLHGFELLMASYAMCHMKLDLLLQETGYRPSDPNNPPRVSVYLTNSLEQYHPDMDTLFASWLSRESNEASRIKKDMPIMVAFGNPPYAVSSSNKGEWIESLMKDYKKDLNEQNINPLSDDFIKFIRYSEHYIEKLGYGVIAIITNNSFIDGNIHRQMRKHLVETFDEIYIYNLHGNANKKERCPDGSVDENVFDIRQGVSISIFIKNNKSKDKFAHVYHHDSYGGREDKYERLTNTSFKDTSYVELVCSKPQYFFVPRKFDNVSEYKNFFSISDLVMLFNVGIKTERDSLVIQMTRNDILKIKHDLSVLDVDDFRSEYSQKPDGRDWKLALAKEDIIQNNPSPIAILHRPFDVRYTLYTGNTKGFHAYPRSEVMDHLLQNDNIALILPKQTLDRLEIYITNAITTHKSSSAYNMNYVFPLYVFQEQMGEIHKSSNLDPKIYSEFKDTITNVTPESLFDYIYAVLHSTEYRQRYAEFLKSDFPRIPYLNDKETFHALYANYT